MELHGGQLKTKIAELRQVGGRALFPFHQKFFTGFKDIHSPETVDRCPDHFRE